MRGRDRLPLGAPHDRARDVERGRDAVLAGEHELGRRLVARGDVVDDRLERRRPSPPVVSETPGSSFAAVLGRGRELGADDEQLALQPDEQLVELGAALGLGTGEPERRDRFVDRAVRVGAGGVLADASAVQETGGAVVTRARVDLREPCAAESTTGAVLADAGPASGSAVRSRR